VVLLILDGWGVREADADNAIAQADTPNWDALLAHCPQTLIATSGEAVGLPDGQMGNSEVGHMNIGAGRVVYQDFLRINRCVAAGELLGQPAFADQLAAYKGGAWHVLALLSPGGVHSHEEHLFGFLREAAAAGVRSMVVHAILDGRDMPPKSAAPSIEKLQSLLDETGVGRIGSVSGRYYAMDRDQRWERVEQAFNAMVWHRSEYAAESAMQALEDAYERGETDEFVKPTIVGDAPALRAEDAVTFMNFRSDRARQLTQALVLDDFSGFDRGDAPRPASMVTLTQYEDGLPVAVAFPPDAPEDTLGEVVSKAGLTQMRLAETEKYAHVTFFFNGGRETVFDGEQRTLVPSPKVATYDLQPEMSAGEVTDALVAAIETQAYDLIVCNYANPDMVGHTGVFEAAIKAVETVDEALGRVTEALRKVGGEALITADHGNVELMRDHQTGQPHTAHTTGPVPLLYFGHQAEALRSGGALCHLAPTLLDMLGIAAPAAMADNPSLLQRKG
jgi:2,3-bisphosphoglycerate-independent phosphoglycerate mutase